MLEPSPTIKEKFGIKKGKSLFSGKLVQSIIPGTAGVCTLILFTSHLHISMPSQIRQDVDH